MSKRVQPPLGGHDQSDPYFLPQGCEDVPKTERRKQNDWWCSALVEIFSSTERRVRLCGWANRCIKRYNWEKTEVAESASDLIHDAVLVALRGGLSLPEPSMDRPEAIEQAMRLLGRTVQNRARHLADRDRRRWKILLGMPTLRKTAFEARVDACLDLRAAMSCLPPKRRDALEKLTLDDQHPAAYAASRGVSPKTARNLRDRAKADVRSWLAGRS